jgi:hypothetical protein
LDRCVRIALSKWHQYPDAPHSVSLLGACHKRPHGRRAADERDEIAPFQLSELHLMSLAEVAA